MQFCNKLRERKSMGVLLIRSEWATFLFCSVWLHAQKKQLHNYVHRCHWSKEIRPCSVFYCYTWWCGPCGGQNSGPTWCNMPGTFSTYLPCSWQSLQVYSCPGFWSTGCYFCRLHAFRNVCIFLLVHRLQSMSLPFQMFCTTNICKYNTHYFSLLYLMFCQYMQYAWKTPSIELAANRNA